MNLNDQKNVLIIGQSTVISDGLIQIALSEAEHGKTVWFLASKPVDKLPEIFIRKDRSILKYIMFTYCKSLEALIQKVVDLDNMNIIAPSFIIIKSLHTFFANSTNRNEDYFLQGYAKTLAFLQNCIYSFNERLKGGWSIVSLDDNEGYSKECLATFIDLFYYKGNYVRVVDATFVRWFEEFKFKFVK